MSAPRDAGCTEKSASENRHKLTREEAQLGGSTGRAKKGRSEVTNDPMSRAKGKAKRLRRLRDWYHAYASRLDPNDVVGQGMALAVAELRTAAEDARKRLLDGDNDAEASVTRLENAARRAALDAEARIQHKPQQTLADVYGDDDGDDDGNQDEVA
jgi:hypothetical protein